MTHPFRRILVRTVISLVITLLWILQAAGLFQVWPVATFERWLYDLRVAVSAPQGLDRRVVIVDIDERSLAREGYWPWGRDRVASLVHTLFDEYGAGLVAFDLVFAEADRSSGLRLLEELKGGWLREDVQFDNVLKLIRPALDWDARFAEAIRGRPVILGYYFRPAGRGRTGVLPPPAAVESPLPLSQAPLPRPEGYTGIYPPLLEPARAAGFVDNPAVDADAVHRRLPMLQYFDGGLYEGLALTVVRSLHGMPPIRLRFGPSPGGAQRLQSLHFGGFDVPVDGRGRALVPYRGRQGSFPYVSAADVLERTVTPELLRDAIVLVGTTSPALTDLRSTPLESLYPGVEIQANMISGILDGRIRQLPGYALPVELLILLAVGLIMSLLLPQIAPHWSLVLGPGLALAVTGINAYFWLVEGAVIPLASAYLLIALLFLLHIVLGFIRERHLKRGLEERFGQYVPPALVEQMIDSPRQEFGFSGESREMTVLFADLRGFTSIAETLPPQELTQFMHDWLTPMTRIIHRHRGTVDKYMGDCVMAFWGAPLEDPEHGRHGLEAAIAMLDEIPRLNRQFAGRGWPQLRLKVGLNSGEMRVGNMGSEFRTAYTVLGDAVNLGSRLEALTDRYGVPLVVNETLRAKAPEYVYLELDRVRVKGKRTPVVVYHPLGRRETLLPDQHSELAQYRRALEHYLRQEWDAAERLLLFLKEGSRFRQLYEVYLDRIAYYRGHPPGPGWNGVFTYLTK